MLDSVLLSILIWLPVAGGVLALLLGEKRVAAARWAALITALAAFGFSICCTAASTAPTAAFQFQQRLPWIPAFNADYHLGVDGIALPLIVLTTFITIPVVIMAWNSVSKRVAQYLAAFLIMEG